jgi:hypothetical protein
MTDQAATPKSYATDIQPMFRPKDRATMDWAFDLWDHQQVKDNAAAILERVEAGDMPCDGPWSPEQVETFRAWMDSGMAE